MRRLALGALPYLVAALVPAGLLAVLFSASGQNPLYGLFGGAIALVGALLAVTVRDTVHRLEAARQLNEITIRWLHDHPARDE